MAMQGTLTDFIVGWLLIPYRIFLELYKNVYPPKESAPEPVHGLDKQDTTIDQRELRHWTKLSQSWWDPEGDLALLRGFNTCRIPMITEAYLKNVANSQTESALPLRGARIIDVGCGAGFVSEPLVEYGATVTAVDMVPEIIKVAQTHWTETHGDEDGPEYICTPVEQLAEERAGMYDMVLCLEVLDHVDNMPEFVEHCCKLLRPGGCAIFSTFNRTLPAMLLGIIGVEHILRIVPMDTHHMYKFVKPQELSTLISKQGLRTVKVTGCFPINPFARRPRWMDIKYTGVTYAMTAVKE